MCYQARGYNVLPRESVARLAIGPTVKITNASPTLRKSKCREDKLIEGSQVLNQTHKTNSLHRIVQNI